MQPGTTHPSLIQGLRSGNALTWTRLVDLYGPLVYAWCRRAGLDDEPAADVMQETFLAVSKSIDRFERRRPGDSFRGWLYGIVRHKIVDHIRRRTTVLSAIGGSSIQRSLAQLPDPTTLEDLSDESQATTESDLTALVRRAAELVQGEFHTQTWQAFWLTAIDGQTATEAAGQLGMQSAAVRKSKSRVSRRLREVLGDAD